MVNITAAPITQNLINSVRNAYANPSTSPANNNDFIANMYVSASNQTLSVNINGIATSKEALNYLNTVVADHASGLQKLTSTNNITGIITSVVATNASSSASLGHRIIQDDYDSYIKSGKNVGSINGSLIISN